MDDSSPSPFLLPLPMPFSPPTTSTTSHHRKKRSKPVCVDPPPTPSSKRPDPLGPKVTRPCTECGKTFWSLKALFGHMRCHPERQWRGINPPPNLLRRCTSPPPSADDCEVAASLLLLASSSVSTSSPTMSKFECSSCKKTFPSHQALGGHRASHKNVKGCFAIDEEGHNCHISGNIKEEIDLGLGLVLGLGHKCWICFKVFTSGQALGGHMRCHGEKTEDPSTSSFGPVSQPIEVQFGIDLNLPAPVVEEGAVHHPVNLQLDLRLGI